VVFVTDRRKWTAEVVMRAQASFRGAQAGPAFTITGGARAINAAATGAV
jgi:hypothetical protein